MIPTVQYNYVTFFFFFNQYRPFLMGCLVKKACTYMNTMGHGLLHCILC